MSTAQGFTPTFQAGLALGLAATIITVVSVAVIESRPPATPIVTMPGLGTVSGEVASVGPVAMFLGVPYAEPPTGSRRWLSPIPAKPWNKTKECMRYKPICPNFPSSISVSGFLQSEDCLYLNIYAPLAVINTTANLPVMFWITGDAFVADTPDNYPGQDLVHASNYSVVVVEVAFRLNIFGFLASDVLLQRDPGAGHLGIADQQMALRWVQQYISSYGGDPTRVTIFGQSAGGASVMNHLVRNDSQGLFSRAIIESGFYSEQVVDFDTANTTYGRVMELLGCNVSNVTCLLAAKTDTLLSVGHQAARKDFVYAPLIDNVTLMGKPWELIQSGDYNNQVPVLIGSCRDEMSKFMELSPHSWPAHMNNETMWSLLVELYNLTEANITKLSNAYSRNKSDYDFPSRRQLGLFSRWWWMLMRIRTDDIFGHCAEHWLAEKFKAGQTPSVFMYVFAHQSPYSLTVGHGAEVPYIFGENLNRAVASMVTYWTNFAASGDPNGPRGNMAYWPPYHNNYTNNTWSNETDAIMEIGTTHQVHYGFRREACKFWDKYHLENGFTSKVAPQVFVLEPKPSISTLELGSSHQVIRKRQRFLPPLALDHFHAS